MHAVTDRGLTVTPPMPRLPQAHKICPKSPCMVPVALKHSSQGTVFVLVGVGLTHPPIVEGRTGGEAGRREVVKRL